MLNNVSSFVVVVVDNVVVGNVLFNLCHCRCTFKQNLYTVCDLALGLLVNKVPLFVICLLMHLICWLLSILFDIGVCCCGNSFTDLNISTPVGP